MYYDNLTLTVLCHHLKPLVAQQIWSLAKKLKNKNN